MVFCPNVNSPEFKELESLFGRSKAFYLWNENKGNPIDLTSNGEKSKLFEDILKVTGNRDNALLHKSFIYTEDFKNFFNELTEEPLLLKKEVDGEIIYYYSKDNKSDNIKDTAHAFTSHNLNVAYNSKRRVNALDDAYLAAREQRNRAKKKNKSKTVYKKDVSKVNLKDYIADVGVDFYMGDDALREQEEGTYSLKHSSLPLENIQAAKNKINYMKKKMNVEVIFDSSINVSGRVLNKNHELTKKYNKPVILINPNFIYTDTVIHEFAHLFIDALGGTSNLRIKLAIEELKETKLYETISRTYSEVSDDMLQKEVLATAMGIEASELFEKRSEQTRWERFMDWVTTNLRKLFNKDLDVSEVKALSSELLNRKFNQNLLNTLDANNDSNRKIIANSSQSEIRDYLKSLDGQLRLDDNTHVYYLGDIPIHTSVTSFINEDSPEFKKHYNIPLLRLTNMKAKREFPPSFTAAFSQLHGFVYLNNEEYLNNLSQEEVDQVNELSEKIWNGWLKQAELGTEIHAVLESYINGDITSLPDKYKSLIGMTKIIDKAKSNGSVFLTESKLMIGDPEVENGSMAASIDLIEITSKSEIIFHDFKTSTNTSTDNIYYNNKHGKHGEQLMVYRSIIENLTDLKVKELLIHNLKINGFDIDTHEFEDVTYEDTKRHHLELGYASAYAKINKRVTDAFLPLIIKNTTSTLSKDSKKLLDKIVDNLDMLIKDYTFNKNPLQTVDKVKLENLKKEIVLLSKETEVHKINLYMENFMKLVIEEMNTTYKQMDVSGKLSSDKFKAYSVYIKSFKETLKSAMDIQNNYYTEAENNKIKGLYVELNTLLGRVESKHAEFVRRHAASSFAQYSNFKYSEHRERYRSEAVAKFGKENDSEISEYVHNKLNEHADEIFQEELEYWNKLFSDPKNDISALEGAIFDPGIIDSQFVQTFNQVFSYHESIVRKKFLEARSIYLSDLKKFDFLKSIGGNMETAFGKFFSKDSKGKDTNFLIGEYKSEFYIQYEKLANDLQKAEANRYYDKESKDAYFTALEAHADFIKNNTYKTKAGTFPINKWKDPNYTKLSKDELKFLNFIKQSFSNADGMLSRLKLSKRVPGIKIPFFKVPTMHKSSMERITENDPMQFLKEKFKDFATLRSTDEDRGELVDEEGNKTIIMKKGNIDDTIRHEVPVYMRGDIDPKDQSKDLLSLALMNYHSSLVSSYKQKIESDMFVMVEAVKDINFIDHVGIVKKLVGNLYSNQEFRGIKDKNVKGSSATLKALNSVFENRLYGIHSISAGKVGTLDLNKIVRGVNSFHSKMVLSLNLPSAGATLLQTEAMKYMEGFAGEYFSISDVNKAHFQVMGDLGKVIQDAYSNVPTSKTRLLMDLFGIQGNFKSMVHKFSNNSFSKKALSNSPLHTFTTMAEFYATATLMYSMMNSIKTTNEQGQFIDVNGKVVTSEKDAMSLYDAYSVNSDNILEVNKHVYATTDNTSIPLKSEIGTIQLSAFMQDIYADLNGQYNDEMRSAFQRLVVGEVVMTLRKWLLRGVNKRYRGFTKVWDRRDELSDDDKFYSQSKKQFVEGHYTTTVRFILSNFIRDFKDLKASILKEKWEELTMHEKANIKRTVFEASMTVFLWLGYTALSNLADDDEDYISIYYTRRLYSELSFYVNGNESMKILKSPAASLGLLGAAINLMGRVISINSWDERYVQGPRKGDLKFTKDIERLFPIIDKYHLLFDDKSTYKNKFEALNNDFL